MSSTISYVQVLKQNVMEKFEVEDLGNVFIKGMSEKGAAEFLALTTDVTGVTKLVVIRAGKIEYKLRDYDGTFVYDTIRRFLESHPVNEVVEAKEFSDCLSDIWDMYIALPQYEPKE